MHCCSLISYFFCWYQCWSTFVGISVPNHMNNENIWLSKHRTDSLLCHLHNLCVSNFINIEINLIWLKAHISLKGEWVSKSSWQQWLFSSSKKCGLGLPHTFMNWACKCWSKSVRYYFIAKRSLTFAIPKTCFDSVNQKLCLIMIHWNIFYPRWIKIV